VGEHRTLDSEEELEAAASEKDDSEVEDSVLRNQVLMQEFESLSKRSYLVRRGRNNRLLVRPILELIFDEGPTSYELSYGLPGQNLLENKIFSDRRISGVGNNFYLRQYVQKML